MISLKQLGYALAVGKTKHFKKAAEQCSVSQSALSAAITEMESQLGVQVFERDTRKVLVTPLGQEILDKAAAIKLQVDDLCLLAQTQREPLSRPLTLGVIPTIAPYLLPQVLPKLHAQHPDLELRIVEDQSSVLVDQVSDGSIDTAILALPFATRGLLTFEFWEEDFFWITHADDKHRPKKRITSQDLKGTGLMLLEEGHCLKDHALAACKFAADEIDNSFASASLNTLVQMVAGKTGTTLVPEMALETLLSISPQLKAMHIDEPGPHRTIAFIMRPNYADRLSIETLRDIFRQELK